MAVKVADASIVAALEKIPGHPAQRDALLAALGIFRRMEIGCTESRPGK